MPNRKHRIGAFILSGLLTISLAACKNGHASGRNHRNSCDNSSHHQGGQNVEGELLGVAVIGGFFLVVAIGDAIWQALRRH